MEPLTDNFRDFLLEDALLADEVFNIMKDAVKKIFKKTEGYKSVRERLIVYLFIHCILTLTNSRYNTDEKIAHSKEDAEHCIKYADIVIKNEKWKEERLEGLKETVTMQQDKINNLDEKIDALESTLRYERNVNKMIMKFLKNKFDS